MGVLLRTSPVQHVTDLRDGDAVARAASVGARCTVTVNPRLVVERGNEGDGAVEWARVRPTFGERPSCFRACMWRLQGSLL